MEGHWNLVNNSEDSGNSEGRLFKLPVLEVGSLRRRKYTIQRTQEVPETDRYIRALKVIRVNCWEGSDWWSCLEDTDLVEFLSSCAASSRAQAFVNHHPCVDTAAFESFFLLSMTRPILLKVDRSFAVAFTDTWITPPPGFTEDWLEGTWTPPQLLPAILLEASNKASWRSRPSSQDPKAKRAQEAEPSSLVSPETVLQFLSRLLSPASSFLSFPFLFFVFCFFFLIENVCRVWNQVNYSVVSLIFVCVCGFSQEHSYPCIFFSMDVQFLHLKKVLVNVQGREWNCPVSKTGNGIVLFPCLQWGSICPLHSASNAVISDCTTMPNLDSFCFSQGA